jgi:hypothetical protein
MSLERRAGVKHPLYIGFSQISEFVLLERRTKGRHAICATLYRYMCIAEAGGRAGPKIPYDSTDGGRGTQSLSSHCAVWRRVWFNACQLIDRQSLPQEQMHDCSMHILSTNPTTLLRSVCTDTQSRHLFAAPQTNILPTYYVRTAATSFRRWGPTTARSSPLYYGFAGASALVERGDLRLSVRWA